MRRVLAGQDATLEDGRYLPVGRYRGKRVNPISWHMINFRQSAGHGYTQLYVWIRVA